MIGHYLLSALAKFRKTPFTTGANILTLALGLACFIAAYGIADWWRSADSYHATAEQTLVVGQGSPAAPGSFGDPLTALSTPTLGRTLRSFMPEVERVARALPRSQAPAAAGERKAFLDMAYVDPEFLEIFDLEFIAGDAATALAAPDRVVLTEAAAGRLFGDAPALGQTVIVDGDRSATVAGVIAPIRQPSFMGDGPDAVLRLDMLTNWRSLSVADQFEADDRWLAANLYTFVVKSPSITLKQFNARLEAFVQDRIPPERLAGARVMFEAFPIGELTTRELDRRLNANGGSGLSVVPTLIGLGVLILLVACVNYANLATAQAAVRTKEISMRKVLGAGRGAITTQAFLEAGLAAGAAVIVAILVLALVAPVVRTSTGIDVLHFLTTWAAPIVFVVTLVVTVALLAGAYPAFVLSRVRSAEALRASRFRSGPKFVARILVGVQFASASFLLILVTVTQLQRAEIERAALARGEDPVVVLNNLATAGVSFETLEARLADAPGVKNISIADRRPWSAARDPIYFTRTPTTDEQTIAAAPMGYLQTVGYDYFATVGLDVLAGRGFDRDRETIATSLYTDDPERIQSVILDETYMRRVGFSSPEEAVGQFIYMPAFTNARMSRPAVTLQIIGITEADEARLEAWRADGNIYVFGQSSAGAGQYPIIQIAREQVPHAVAAITEAWDALAPTVPVDIQFFDQLFEQSYRRYARVSQVFTLLASAAFVIASVGLLGIAVHVTSQRRREIGVRKVLGSSTLRVLRMLVADFSKPVIVGNLLAWPFAWLAAQSYLQAFAQRTPLTPLPFILSLAVTLLIAWASVGGQAWRAARVKPALVLKAE